ncbi:hypothetical protein Mapa_017068 [Marchantia paleacea]|nr:hypothetical protein Mapa_017068 [Marchantia paleacea]
MPKLKPQRRPGGRTDYEAYLDLRTIVYTRLGQSTSTATDNTAETLKLWTSKTVPSDAGWAPLRRTRTSYVQNCEQVPEEGNNTLRVLEKKLNLATFVYSFDIP